MPKLKTHKGAAKRFKVTGRGKLLRMKAGRTHLRRKRSKRALHAMRQYQPVSQSDAKRVRRVLQEPVKSSATPESPAGDMVESGDGEH